MGRKYAAFDIETAKIVPGADFNWQPHRPLGISCAAVLQCDALHPAVWYGRNADSSTAKQMSQSEARQVVDQLADLVSQNYTLLTWNGLSFDFDVLAEESNSFKECETLAMNHVDMMFRVFCDRGFPVALDKAAQALKIPGKSEGMSGKLAPQLWADAKYQEVIAYVSQDVRMALQIALTCEQRRTFQWKTQKSSISSMPLPHGWLTVKEALKLPEPDTSWMKNPISRRRFTQWTARTN